MFSNHPSYGNTLPSHDLTSEFETSLSFLDPQIHDDWRHHKVTIHPYDQLLTTKWKDWPAWRIFNDERVARIPRDFPADVLNKVSDHKWRRQDAGLTVDECYVQLKKENQPRALKHVNAEIEAHCKRVLHSVFENCPQKPKFVQLEHWLLREEPKEEGVLVAGMGELLHVVHGDYKPTYLLPNYDMYNIHFFLHKKNTGSGLAFLLNSRLSPQKSELGAHGGETSVLYVDHRPYHIWMASPRMTDAHAMLFCSSLSSNNIAAHSAYSASRTGDYVPRRSLKMRFRVIPPAAHDIQHAHGPSPAHGTPLSPTNPGRHQ